MLAPFPQPDSAAVQTQLYNETHSYWASIALIDPAELHLAWVTPRPLSCSQRIQLGSLQNMLARYPPATYTCHDSAEPLAGTSGLAITVHVAYRLSALCLL